MKKIKIISLGADPECFIHADDIGFISSEGLIEGDKDLPTSLGNGFFIQKDNVMVEFNIPPCHTLDEFISNIELGKSLSLDCLPEGLNLLFTPDAEFSEEDLFTPHARVFGCDPDFDAYQNGAMVEPIKLKNTTKRFAGGHVHIGIEDSEDVEVATKINFIKSLDLFLGIPSLLNDNSNERRAFYGKLGKFRYKPYGVEYRTLSNYWLRNAVEVTKVYNNTQQAAEFTNLNGMDNALEKKMVEIYTKQDKEEALKLCDSFGIKV